MRISSLFFVLLSVSVPLTADVRVGVSDLFSPALVETLEAEFDALEIQAEAVRRGSMLALDALEAGEIDAAIIALPGEVVPEGSFRVMPCAYQVVTILVHESNPIREISLPRLRQIYAERGNLDEWGRLGASGTWAPRRITPYAVRQPENIGLEIFRYYVLQNAPMRPSTRYRTSISAVLADVSDDNTAIAVLPAPRPAARGRALFVARDDESQAYSPTPDNVMFGDYPLRLSFALVFSDQLEREKLRAIQRGVFSDRFAQALLNADFMPLPDRERRDRLMEAEGRMD